MANKSFTLNFDASMNISQIKSAISEMQRAFSGLKLSQGLNTNIQNAFDKINSELEKFENLTNKSFHSLSDVSKASSSFERIINYYKQLEKYGKEITGMDKEKFFSDSVVNNIAKANKALQTYYKELEAIPTEIEKANKALEEQEATLGSLTQKRNALAAENKSLGSAKGGITKKISSKEAKQAELTSKMSALESQGTKKSSAEYKALASQYNILTQELKKLKSESAELDSTMAKNRATIANLDSQINSTTTNISQLKQELSQMTQSLNTASLNRLRNSLAEITGQDISQIPSDIKEIQNIINNLSDEEIKRIYIAFENIRESATNARTPIKQTKKNLDEFGTSADTMAKTTKEVDRLKEQVMDFFSISNAVQLFKRTISSAFDTVKELDAAMTETAVVTDFSVGDMWNSLPQYTSTANKLGATIQGVYETMTLFYQQGLNTTETFEIGTETLKMARIAGLDYAQTTDLMTAALRGFNMELNATSAQRINDVYSELAAITASDTKEIATAMTKTASIAASANMEFETTAAFLAQMIETTRESAENLGTAMKTIIARFTEIKKDPTGIVEVEGETVSFNDIDDALRSVGVSLTDTNGKFRDLDDVFLDLSGKWNTLDIMQQRYIATVAAGSRQQSRFIAMMNNYERTMELVNAANNSAGASEEQFGKTMESLEAKLNKLKNAWDQFTMGIMNSEVIKFGVDLLTQIITAINNITDALPGPIDGFAKLAIAIGGLKVGKKVFDSLFSFFRKSFSEKGEENGNGFVEGITKAFTGRSSKISPQAKTFAGKIAKEVNGSFKQRFKEETRDSQWLASLFDDTSSVSREAAAAMPKMAKGLITDFKKSISYYSLTDSGKTLADSYIKGFSEQIKKGNMQEAIKTLEKGFNDSKFGKEGGNWSRKGKNDPDKAFGLSKNTIDSIGTSTAALSGIVAGLASAVTMVSASLRESGYEEVANVLDGIAVALGIVSAAFGIMSAAATIAGSATWAALAPLLPIILPIVAAIGLITTAIVAMNNAAYNNSAAKALKDAEEAAEAAEKAADGAKQAYDDLLNSFDSYNSALERLNELTVGTQAWREELANVNQQVLDLLEIFPELSKYITRGEQGNLGLDAEGQEQAKEKAAEAVDNSQAYTTFTSIQELYAKNDVGEESFGDLLRDKTGNFGGYGGLEAEVEGLLKLYRETPEVFDRQEVTQESFESMTPAQQKELMDNYSASSKDAFIEQINGGDVYKYDDRLLEFISKMYFGPRNYNENGTPVYSTYGTAHIADGYSNILKDLASYSKLAEGNIGTSKDLLNSLLSTRIDSSVLDSELGSRILSITGDNYAENFDQNLEERAREFYKNDKYDTSDDDKVQEELIKRDITPHRNELEDLQLLYADMMNIPVDQIDNKIKNDSQKLAEAIASMYSTDEISSNIEELYNKIYATNSESALEMLDLLSKNADAFSPEKLKELSKMDSTKYFEDIAKDLGMSIEDLASSLGLSVEDLASSFSESVDAIQKEQNKTKVSLVKSMMTSGAYKNSQEMMTALGKMSNEQQEYLQSSLEKMAPMGEKAQTALLQQMPDISQDVEAYKEVQSLIDDINFNNPIDSALALQEAMESDNASVKKLAQSLEEASGEAFSTGEQFKYILQSEGFKEIDEQLDEFIEETGKISSQNIEEIAKSNADLNKLLSQGKVNANGLAKALTQVKLDNIDVDSLSTRVLEAVSSVITLDDALYEMQDTINNFDPGIDAGSGIDFLSDAYEKMNEFAENMEYGNPQFKNYFEQIFGEGAFDSALSKINPEAVFNEKIEELKNWTLGNGYGFWEQIGSGNIEVEGLAAQMTSAGDVLLGSINEETGKFEDVVTLSTEQLANNIADAAGVSYDTAIMMIQNYSAHSLDFAKQMAENDFKAAVEALINPEEESAASKISVISKQEVESFAISMGKSYDDAVKYINEQSKGTIKIVDWIDPNTGAQYVGQELYDNVMSQLEVQTPKELLTKLDIDTTGAKIDIQEIQDAISSLGFDEETTNSLVNSIVGSMNEGVEEGKETMLQQTIEVPVKATLEDGTEGIKMESITVKATTVEGLQAGIDSEIKAADYDLVSEKIVDQDFSGLATNIETIMSEASQNAATKLKTDINNITFKDKTLTINPELSQKAVTLGINYAEESKPASTTDSNAKGTGPSGFKKDGTSLVGEEGEELVQDKNGAYLVGTDGPEIVPLNKGDIVYSNEDTKKILRGKSHPKIKRYALGKWPTKDKEEYWSSGSDSKEDSDSKSSGKSEAEEEAEIWENTFDWLYNLTQDINEELREREKLEKKYNRLIEDRNKSATDILKNIRAQEASLKQQRKLQQQMYDKRKQEMQRTLSEYSDVSQYGTYNWSDNTVEINWNAIDKVTDTEKGERIEEYISKLEEIESQMDDAEDALDDIIDEIEDLQKIGKDEYDDLESRVLNAIISREQEKIDKLSLINESINDANTKLMNSIQSNLDKIRQDRQNQETEQSIEDNERRLAYLQQDTSGANALEIQQLQEELTNQKQDYTDTLIDQKLSAIQEQNDKASEERQYQIELAQAQLEEAQKNGEFWNEAYRLIKEGTNATGKLVQNSELTALLKDGEAWKSMSNIQKMDWLSELENTTKAAMVYFSSQRQLEKIGKKSGKITFTNANGEKLTGTVQKDGSVKVSTRKGTYTYKEVFQNYDGTYETLETNPSFKANAPSKPSNSGKGSGSIKVGGLINAGKAQIYDYAGDKSGERQYFLNDPIYKVLDEKNGYLLTRWHKLNTGYTGWFKKSDVKAYAKGGLADFTGPAWLDGTKSKPELVLNARDTENFIQLKDILSNLLRGNTSSGNSGDNYFEIHIDVDSLNNDYDVEQLATKIKKMINDDARYRNVNSINLLR